MYTGIKVYIYTCIHEYTRYVYNTHVYTCTRVCMCIHVCVCVYTCIQVYKNTRMHVTRFQLSREFKKPGPPLQSNLNFRLDCTSAPGLPGIIPEKCKSRGAGAIESEFRLDCNGATGFLNSLWQKTVLRCVKSAELLYVADSVRNKRKASGTLGAGSGGLGDLVSAVSCELSGA